MRFPSPALSVSMKPHRRYCCRHQEGTGSHADVLQLAKLAKDNETQLLFSQLANMERGHKARLEDIYTNMAFPEVW